MIPLSCSGQAAIDGNEQLVKVVVLTRHGVRAPTQSSVELAHWSMKKWPLWPVAAGQLSPRGAVLIEAQWNEKRAFFTQAGLLPQNSCPQPEDIFVLADSDERTQATARALLKGLAPECGLQFATDNTATQARQNHVRPNTRYDALFHPLEAGVTHLEPAAARADINRATPGGLYGLEQSMQQPIQALSALLGPLDPAWCQEKYRMGHCTLLDLPTQLHFTANDTDLEITGRLGIASSVAEILLLEYAQWPGRNAGWGAVDERTLRALLPVHSQTFAALNRAYDVALNRGGPLLQAISASLSGAADNPAMNRALVFFVGHDTNIAAVAALLGLHWKLDDYAPDAVPPGSALVFSVWKKGDSSFVRVDFWAPSLASLHRKVPVDPKSTEFLMESQHLAFVNMPLQGSHCSLAQFKLLVSEAILK